MQRAQDEIAEMEVEGSAGGGAVKVTASGDGRVLAITIDPELWDGPPDPDDIEMLGDTVTAAVNDALGKAKETQEKVLGPITGGLGGLGLPGM
jgi:DNA-binding YbaB/EbfC family protein